MERYQDLISTLQSAIGLLDFDRDAPLRKEAIAICESFQNPVFRIAVFGPFNYGKSTLLNAILGQRALPIDLIPTTGAAIHIGYGKELQTRITLQDGSQINDTGTAILKQYAILDNQRCMRDDVASVWVSCPHPFLKTGVELIDLPGTNDRQAQDTLIRDRLLGADLVVQVLDARQVMTLQERETLRDWLLDRGINTVVFVANFLNLLEPDDQKAVFHRLRFVAESFRAELPAGLSNLYRVDALPALRARLKGDTAAAQTTGLASFESALQAITAARQEQLEANRLPRLNAIASQIKQALQAKAQALTQDIAATQQKHRAKIELKQKAEKLIKQGFQASSSEFQSWLYLPKLLQNYQEHIARALQQGNFYSQETESFQQEVLKYQRALNEWVDKACDFFEQEHPGTLDIIFPEVPQVSPPHPPNISPPPGSLRWKLGVAAAKGASYILNEIQRQGQPDRATPSETSAIDSIYLDAARDYLTRFSNEAFAALRHYETKAEAVLSFQSERESLAIAEQQHQLDLLQAILARLERE